MTTPDDPALGRATMPTEREIPENKDELTEVDHYRDIATGALNDAEAWLREGALIRAIPEALPDAVLVSDNAGIVMMVNAQLELMFGYHRSDIIGQRVEMLLPADARAKHVQQRFAYSMNPRVRPLKENVHLRGLTKGGIEFGVLISLGPVVIPDGVFTIAVLRRTHG